MSNVGRPLKFENKEALKEAKDGLVEINPKELHTNEFNNEKCLEEFIIYNIEIFTKDYLEDELVSFEANVPLEVQHFSPRGRRVDLVITGKNRKYIIELKNPSSGTESRAAIGQILDYGREFLDPKKQLLIITTKFDINTARTIKHYNLPIRYLYLDKSKILEYLRSEKND